MKILKIFGVVVGIHVFALILIFANPGCSSTNPPSATETVAKTDPTPTSVGAPTPVSGGEITPVTVPPASFDPNAPATVSMRASPTRPNTPVAAVLEAEPVADVTPATTYSVSKGDSLWTIAKKNHLTVTELAAANNIKPSSTVHLGQKLIIPSKALPAGTSAGHKAVDKSAAKASAAPETASTATPAGDTAGRRTGEIRHTVKSGETLGGIAHKYHVKKSDIEVANNISDPRKIRPGMELIIPNAQGGTTTSATPAKSSTPATSPASQPPADSPFSPVPDQPTDANGKPKASEPPILKVDDSSTPQKQ